MRKQLLAILSALGLAGATAPAQGQVLKGAKNDKTRTESTIKLTKAAQENNAAIGREDRKDKWAKARSGNSSASTQNKIQKNAAESNAARNAATGKHIKGAAESKAAHAASIVKGTKLQNNLKTNQKK